MYPKTLISRIILWLWKMYHCRHGLHLFMESDQCDACKILLCEETFLIDPDEDPPWACPNFADHEDWHDCYACQQNYDLWTQNDSEIM